MQHSREMVLKYLRAELDPAQLRLMGTVVIQPQREEVVFRMPSGLSSLDELYCKIEAVCLRHSIRPRRAESFATVEDLDRVLGAVEWLWQKWIPKGFVTMIAGDPGSGKSWHALDFVRIVTTGDPWPLTTNKHEPQNAVWIEAEASQQLLMERTKSLRVARNMVSIPMVDDDLLGQPDLYNDAHREQITNLVVAKKPQIVVLDSLGGANSRGENKVEEVRPILAYLAEMARDRNTSVVVIHHLRKLGHDEDIEIALNRIRGSTAITAYCRSIIGIRRLQEGANKMTLVKSNLVARFPNAMSVTSTYSGDDITSMVYEEFKAPPPKRNKKDLCAEWLWQQLTAAKEGVDLKELCERGMAFGYSRANIYTAKDMLNDQIAVTGTGNHAHWAINTDHDSAEAIMSELFRI